MNNLQKGIKAAAICFAIFLIITICSGILSGLYFFTLPKTKRVKPRKIS